MLYAGDTNGDPSCIINININREAVTIDSCYNGGFMAGRIVSAFVAALLLPRFINLDHEDDI